jgi:hypothetical protein
MLIFLLFFGLCKFWQRRTSAGRTQNSAVQNAPFIHKGDTKVTIRLSNRTKTVFFFLAYCTKNSQQARKKRKY